MLYTKPESSAILPMISQLPAWIAPVKLTRSASLWLSLLLLVCSLGLTACGAGTPRSIVQQALAFQIAEGSSPRQVLVGHDLVARHSQILEVKVRKDRTLTVHTASGSKLEGHQLTGTYTLSIQPPGDRRSYRRQAEPFQLTLAQAGEPKTWLLAYPVAESKNKLWSTVPFLPQIPSSETVIPAPDQEEEQAS
jgi:hypothetical protein